MARRMRDHILFCSQGRIGMINLDSGREDYLRFNAPGQACWQPGPAFSDGKRIIIWSQEPPENPKADFGAKDSIAFARTHLWIHDFESGGLDEIRLRSLTSIAGLLPGEERVLATWNVDGRMRILTADLDGSHQSAIDSQAGYAYGTSLSPDGTRAAYHITNVPGRNAYEIYIVDLQTRERLPLASHPDYLHFGPEWSPDGRWILYQRCAHKQDPGHERSDICISRSDGSEHRVLTHGQSHWFATSYGSPKTRGGGSNIPRWSPDGRAVTYTRLLPGARTAWQYRPDRPNRDHFNRDYRPKEARGGTDICLIDPETGLITTITHGRPLIWNWRTEWSHDSTQISFSRAAVGHPSEVWTMGSDGGDERFLTRGLDELGADFARFYRLDVG